jgi:hypothetical protein
MKLVNFRQHNPGDPPALRGGSSSLTFPEVDPPTKLPIVSRQAHERKLHRWIHRTLPIRAILKTNQEIKLRAGGVRDVLHCGSSLGSLIS